jgi:hypothetical protein
MALAAAHRSNYLSSRQVLKRGKIHRHTRLVPQPIPIPQWRFSNFHVDLVGPLQYSNNFNFIFTIIDRTLKWMEDIPLSETSAVACAKA